MQGDIGNNLIHVCGIICYRFTAMVDSSWTFIVICIVLRLLEGVGTAMLTTAIFSTFPHLFPKAVGTLMVRTYSACVYSYYS